MAEGCWNSNPFYVMADTDGCAVLVHDGVQKCQETCSLFDSSSPAVAKVIGGKKIIIIKRKPVSKGFAVLGEF